MAIGTLIDVNTEDGVLLAKIVDETEDTYSIKYLSPIKRKYNDLRVYDYDECTENIEKECVSGFYDTGDEAVAGYTLVEGGGFILNEDSDDDYDPTSDEDEDDSDEESLCDSDSESEENVEIE